MKINFSHNVGNCFFINSRQARECFFDLGCDKDSTIPSQTLPIKPHLLYNPSNQHVFQVSYYKQFGTNVFIALYSTQRIWMDDKSPSSSWSLTLCLKGTANFTARPDTHKGNGGDCLHALHAPWSLPWCPWNAPVNFLIGCPLPRRKCLGAFPFQKRSIQACIALPFCKLLGKPLFWHCCTLSFQRIVNGLLFWYVHILCF